MEPGDLSFAEGEIINVTQAEGEWWSGYIGTSDRAGIFPANYVDKYTASMPSGDGDQGYNDNPNLSSQLSSHPVPTFGSSISNETKSYMNVNSREMDTIDSGTNVTYTGDTTSTDTAPVQPAKSPIGLKSKKYEVATVLANYRATGEGQLNLTRGQLITVRKKSDAGWWEGEIQSKTKRREVGWFPASYVKILGSDTSSRQSSTRTTPVIFDDVVMPFTEAPVYNDHANEETRNIEQPTTPMRGTNIKNKSPIE